MECQKQKTTIYIYVISNVIIYNLFIILFYPFLLCSLILSFCNTIFNLFFTLSLCNIYFYFVIQCYHIVFDIFKMLSLFLLCVFILSYLSIATYYCSKNTSHATRCCVSVLVPCALVFKMIILQPLAPKAKNFYLYCDIQWDLRDHACEALRHVL